jgi:hypothetical protein
MDIRSVFPILSEEQQWGLRVICRNIGVRPWEAVSPEVIEFLIECGYLRPDIHGPVATPAAWMYDLSYL